MKVIFLLLSWLLLMVVAVTLLGQGIVSPITGSIPIFAPATPLVISHGAGSSATSTLVLGPFNTNRAKLLVVTCADFFSVACAVADTNLNFWTAGGKNTAGPGSQGVQQFWVLVPATSGSDTITITGASPSAEFIAFSVGSSLDVQSQAPASGGTVQAGAITPTVNGDIVITGVSANAAVSSLTVDSGFNVSDAQPSPVSWPSAMAYLLQSTAATVNPTWTGPTQALSATITAFKP